MTSYDNMVSRILVSKDHSPLLRWAIFKSENGCRENLGDLKKMLDTKTLLVVPAGYADSVKDFILTDSKDGSMLVLKSIPLPENSTGIEFNCLCMVSVYEMLVKVISPVSKVHKIIISLGFSFKVNDMTQDVTFTDLVLIKNLGVNPVEIKSMLITGCILDTSTKTYKTCTHPISLMSHVSLDQTMLDIKIFAQVISSKCDMADGVRQVLAKLKKELYLDN